MDGPVRSSCHPGRHADRTCCGRPTQSRLRLVETSPGPDEMTKFAAMLAAARTTPIMLLAAAAGRRRRGTPSVASRRNIRAGRHHIPPRSSVRQSHGLATRATLASAPTQSFWQRVKAADLSLPSARGWANCRRRVTRCSKFRSRRCLYPCASRRRRARPCLSARSLRSTPRRRPSPRR